MATTLESQGGSSSPLQSAASTERGGHASKRRKLTEHTAADIVHSSHTDSVSQPGELHHARVIKVAPPAEDQPRSQATPHMPTSTQPTAPTAGSMASLASQAVGWQSGLLRAQIMAAATAANQSPMFLSYAGLSPSGIPTNSNGGLFSLPNMYCDPSLYDGMPQSQQVGYPMAHAVAGGMAGMTMGSMSARGGPPGMFGLPPGALPMPNHTPVPDTEPLGDESTEDEDEDEDDGDGDGEGDGKKQDGGFQPFPCTICGKGFGTQTSLTAHLRTVNHYRCHICQESFPTQETLAGHQCRAAFQEQHITASLPTHPHATLTSPIIPALLPPPPTYLLQEANTHHCTLCTTAFNTRSELEAHLSQHQQQHQQQLKRQQDQIAKAKRRFQCGVCKREFSRKQDMTVHMRGHQDEQDQKDKPHRCDQCGTRFAREDELAAHLRFHMEEKPFACEKCGKRFARRTNVTRHMRTHTGEKPYGCPKCGKRFKVRHHLTGHLRTHTGEKPYACTRCGKRFNDRGNLNRHLRTHAK